MSRAPDEKSADEILLECRRPSDYLTRGAELERAAGGPEALAGVTTALAAVGAAGVDRDPERHLAPLRGRLLGSLGRAGRFGRFADRVARLFDLPIETAARLVAKLEDPRSSAWHPWFDGVEMMLVTPGPRFEGASAGFGRLRSGARFPHHDHVGDELTLVLDGGFRNEDDGVEVWRGEELFKPAGTDHAFTVLDGVDCIAAVLALGGVKFR